MNHSPEVALVEMIMMRDAEIKRLREALQVARRWMPVHPLPNTGAVDDCKIVDGALPHNVELAERTVRAWHTIARQMCDLAIKGDCAAIERVYFDAAMSLPFYGADPDPLPSQKGGDRIGK